MRYKNPYPPRVITPWRRKQYPPHNGRTPRRRDSVLHFIRGFFEEHGYSPSLREIKDGCNITSTSVVNSDLHALQELGLLTTQPGKSRTIVLTGATWTAPPNGDADVHS